MLRIALFLLIPSVLPAQDFTSAVQPILRKRCSGCHGAAMQTKGLRLDTGSAALKFDYLLPVTGEVTGEVAGEVANGLRLAGCGKAPR